MLFFRVWCKLFKAQRNTTKKHSSGHFISWGSEVPEVSMETGLKKNIKRFDAHGPRACPTFSCPHCGRRDAIFIHFGLGWLGLCCNRIVYNNEELPGHEGDGETNDDLSRLIHSGPGRKARFLILTVMLPRTVYDEIRARTFREPRCHTD